MTASAAVHTWITYLGIGCVGFAGTITLLALLAGVVRCVEGRHRRRHERRRPPREDFPFGTTAAGRWER